MGSGVTAPCIRNLGTTFRRNFSFISQRKGPGTHPSNGKTVGPSAPVWIVFEISLWDLQRLSGSCSKYASRTFSACLDSVQNIPVRPLAPVWILFKISQWGFQRPSGSCSKYASGTFSASLDSVQNMPMGPSAPVWIVFKICQ